jgi:thiol-disulfide isomerase/thioredoxin
MAILLLAVAPLGMAQSLGDAARAQKDKQNAATKKPAKVYTNDDFSSGNAKTGQSAPPDNPASPEATSSSGVPTLAAESGNGSTVHLTPDSVTNIIFMATWCPHSKALKDILNDPRSRPYWGNNKLVFIFSKNEWARAKVDLDDLVKSGKIPESKAAEILEEMKREAGSPYVMDPKFLNDLPGDYYFCSHPKEVTGYPTVLSLHGYANRMNWLINELKMPRDLFNKLQDEYDSETSGAFGK